MSGVKGMHDKLLKSPARLDAWRNGVRIGLIRNRLQKHFLGEIELTSTQLKAAELLLSRTVPAMQSFEHTGAVDLNHIARIPQPAENSEQWAQQHSPLERKQPTIN